MTTKNTTVGLELTTSSQDVYTVPSQFRAEIESIVISNKTGSTTTFTVQWYSLKNNTNYPLFFTTNIDPYATIQMTWSLFLDAGDKVKALAAVNSAITISVKSTETYQPKQF